MTEPPAPPGAKNLTPWYADFRLYFLLFVVLTLFMLKAAFGSDYGCRGLARMGKDAAAPAFEVAGLDGSKISLADLKGKVVLVNFWATWCKPCVSELPALQQLFKRYENNPDFRLLAISCDEEEDKAVRDFLADFSRSRAVSPLTFPIYHDRTQRSARAFGIDGFPTTFLIDRKGIVRKWFVGPRDYNDKRFFAMVDELLREPAPPS
jgi:thiol-disulfide isomerase/thioredoxin